MSDLIKNITAWTATQGQKQPERSTARKWLLGLGVGAVVFATVAYLYYTAWKKGRLLARLEHDRDVAEERSNQAAYQARVLVDVETAAKAREAYVQAVKDEAKISLDILQARTEAVQTTKAIDDLKSWSDVDTFTSKPGSRGPSA